MKRQRYLYVRNEFRPFLAGFAPSWRDYEEGVDFERHSYQFFLPYSRRRAFTVSEEFEDGKRVRVFAGFNYERSTGRIETSDDDSIDTLLAKGAAILATRANLPAVELARRPGKRPRIVEVKPFQLKRSDAYMLSIGG